MKRLFIEAKWFTVELAECKSLGLLENIQALILEDPERGDLIQGTGGVRKLRAADPSRGKGKRGGYRILYLDLPDRDHTHLLLLYDKGSADNITADEKRAIKALVDQIKAGKRLGT